MPAKSKQQQKAAGMALAVKRRKGSRKALRGAAKQMYEGMTAAELRDYAGTKRKGLPRKKRKKKK